jgi:hypothetical protein
MMTLYNKRKKKENFLTIIYNNIMFETVKNELSNFGAVDKKIKHDPNIPFGKNNYAHIF